jgi:LPS-assembly protein
VIIAGDPVPTWAQDAPVIATAPPVSSGSDQTVTITADGDNSMIGEIATANDNVVLTSKGDTLYADRLIYDRSTKVVTAWGDVRIYTGVRVYRGDTVTYNLDTKAITSANYRALDYPKLLAGTSVTTPEPNHYRLKNASFTTNNRQNPSFRLQAGTMEYRPNDQVVMKNVVLYIGDMPVMYFPIFVQSLVDKRPAYEFDIGNSGQFGAFMDNKYNFVVNDRLRGTAEFDAREKRGYATGLDLQYFPGLNSDMLLKTYYAQDNLYAATNPNVPNPRSHGDPNNSSVYDGVPHDNRYRISFQQHLDFGNGFYSIADLNKWSDPWITRDYFPGEYQQQNQPPNFVDLTESNPNFTVSLLASPQVNPFFQTSVRLPEFDVDTKQQKIFGTDIEYTSTSSVVNFEQRFADTTYFQDPGSYIFNSFPTIRAARTTSTTRPSKTTTTPSATTPTTNFRTPTSTSISSRSRRASAAGSPIISTTTATRTTPSTATAFPTMRSRTRRPASPPMPGWPATSRFRAPGSMRRFPPSASTGSGTSSSPFSTPNTRRPRP